MTEIELQTMDGKHVAKMVVPFTKVPQIVTWHERYFVLAEDGYGPPVYNEARGFFVALGY